MKRRPEAILFLIPTAGLSPCCMPFTAVLTPAEEGGFTAYNPETGTTTQGETVDEAVANLREATELYLEEFPSRRAFGPSLMTTFELSHA